MLREDAHPCSSQARSAREGSQTKEEIRKLNVKKIRKEVIKLPSIADVIIFK